MNIVRAIGKYCYALIASIYLFTIGWIVSGRARGLISTIAGHFGFRANEFRIPEVKLSAIVRPGCEIRVVELPENDGNITLQELSVITALVKQANPRTIFEIGTFDGRTTLNMAVNTGDDGRIFTLDLPKEQLDSTRLHITTGDRVFVDKPESGARFKSAPVSRKITQLYGDSASFDFAPYFNTIDVVFLDGSHSYEYVRNDSEIGLQLLRNGHGTILWHDYTAWPGVTKALNELFLTDPRFAHIRHIVGTTLVYITK